MQTRTRSLTGAVAAALVLALAGSAHAQDGAGRWLASAFPVGGIFFTEGDTESSPSFGDYTLGGAVAYNINRYIGIEGEIGGAVGLEQSLDGAAFGDASVPRTLSYSGNVIYSFLGNDRRLAPYAAGGLGGFTMFTRDAVEELGITDTRTLLAGNVGGGLTWLASSRWGLRADYRAIVLDGRSNTPAFIGTDETRWAHRVTGGIVLTSVGR
jgi:hypothetical protein